MKITIIYPTSEKQYVSTNCFHYIYKTADLDPVMMFRYPCGAGVAASRYTYAADFKAPDDAAFPTNGLIRANITRKENKHFNPKKCKWDGQKSIEWDL